VLSPTNMWAAITAPEHLILAITVCIAEQNDQ